MFGGGRGGGIVILLECLSHWVSLDNVFLITGVCLDAELNWAVAMLLVK